jgi:LPS O-antigen subunit length determinant protein (WzzB/FepE family)
MERQLQDDEISLKELIVRFHEWNNYLLSKWLIIIATGIIGGIIGITYAYIHKPKYSAELSFVLEGEQSGAGLGTYSGLASMVGIDLGNNSGGGIFVGDNLMEFMKSRAMIEKTLLTSIYRNGKELTLAEFYIDINHLRKSWETDNRLKDIHFLSGQDRSKFDRAKDSLLLNFYKSIIKNNIDVTKKDKKLNIITVTVKTQNELFSKYFTETLVKVVSDFYVATKTKRSAENLFILQHQTDSVRRELNLAISGVATSTDINPNPNPSRQLVRVPAQRHLVDVETNKAILQELVKNLEVAKVSLRKETPLIQVIDKPILPLEKIEYSKSTFLIIGSLIGVIVVLACLIFKKLFDEIWMS